MTNPRSPLIALVGQTASGKSSLAVKLARYFGGEIVCGDSTTIYRYFDIGAAKPTPTTRQDIPHYLLDIVDVRDGFSVAAFQKRALRVIGDIQNRGKLPFLVGGSGLYIDSVLFSYRFLPMPSPEQRHRLNLLSLAELQKEALRLNLDIAGIDIHNKRRIIRLIETMGKRHSRQLVLRPNTSVIGISPTPEKLREAIEKRANDMISLGLEQEVRKLASMYGWNVEPMKSVGYREWQAYFEGSISRQEVRERIVSDTVALAKRQNTWFKRNKSIHWVSNGDKFAESVEIITTHLNKHAL